MKKILLFITLSISLYAQQILLVVTEDFNTSQGILEAYENGKKVFSNIPVLVGKNGLGWGIGIKTIPHQTNEPIKEEGDKKAPAGIFKITSAFGSKKNLHLKLPYIYTKDMICVDDSYSKNYNKIIKNNYKEKSFEYMQRKDDLYEIGVVIDHNHYQIPKRGSCIFLHVKRKNNTPTVGCTAMSKKELMKILQWLDPTQEPLLIQIPKQYLHIVKKMFNL